MNSKLGSIIKWVGISLVILIAISSGWVYSAKINQDNNVAISALDEKVGSLNSELDQTKNDLTSANNVIKEKEADIANIRNDLNQAKSNYERILSDYTEVSGQVKSYESKMKCNVKTPFTPDYSSNAAMSKALKEFVGEYQGSVKTAEWETIWSNSNAAIHRLTTEYLYIFIVTFDDPGNNFAKSVFWVGHMCFLD